MSAREEVVMEVDARTGARAMRECPKFSSCSAALCPLDADWQKRSFVKADSICAWQREALAPGAEQSFAALDISDIWARIQFTGDAMRKRHPDLAARLDAAAEYRNDPEAKEKLKARFAGVKKPGRTQMPGLRAAGIESGGTKPSTQHDPATR